ncbi:ATP-dependent DNA ligase [Arthrobacter sp. alpha11c]
MSQQNGNFPSALRPPLEVALAKAVPSLPPPNALPGGSWYEPKFDGYRCVLVVDQTVTLWSRQRKELTRYFPDLVAAAERQLPEVCIVDGEAVIWNNNRLDFDALQRRMVTSKAELPALARQLPATFAAFDVLAVAGQDTRGVPFSDRRALLGELAKDWTPPLALSPGTTDPELARTWLEELPASGVEGLVVKGLLQTYAPGIRSWLKVKHRNVTDIVCAAVIGDISQPQAIIAGLPVDATLRIVGRSTVLTTRTARELARYLKPAQPDHPWPEEISESSLNRFSKEKGPVRLTLVEPLVVEVSADVAWSGQAFRHSLRFLRARPELDPTEVELPPNIPIR